MCRITQKQKTKTRKQKSGKQKLRPNQKTESRNGSVKKLKVEIQKTEINFCSPRLVKWPCLFHRLLSKFKHLT